MAHTPLCVIFFFSWHYVSEIPLFFDTEWILALAVLYSIVWLHDNLSIPLEMFIRAISHLDHIIL